MNTANLLHLPSNGNQALPPDHHLAYVAYAPVPPLTELEKEYSGRTSVSPVFDGRSWKKHESCQSIVEPPRERAFWLAVPPNETLRDSEKIIAWAAEQRTKFAPKGYRPATHQELVEFARKYPELQGQFWIVALGSFTFLNDRRVVAVLDTDRGKRVLGGDWCDYKWYAKYRFLLVRN